jgi:methylenetetrahydrofolate dehydrogenase (NADP+)/methenyltetrahydrofolate cyclohydrolase
VTYRARIIDGKAIAAQLRAEAAVEAAALSVRPHLAAVLLGDNPASRSYVSGKGKAFAEAGLRFTLHERPSDFSEAGLLELVAELNGDADTHGILVQLPLPEHIDAEKVIQAIAPEKDVDGFHAANAGALALGLPGLVPCTALGVVQLARAAAGDSGLAGLHAVIIGRSRIVGKPAAALLLAESCTVTSAHSKTRDLAALCRQADILVAAVGKPELVRGDWIKPGAVVIDVGINRVPAPEKGAGATKLAGDVHFAEAAAVAGAITPVPGGVGPMTIANLLANTVEAARRQSRTG